MGEAHAISLALELEADRILIDERKGRGVATRKGLQVIGTLAVLAAASEQDTGIGVGQGELLGIGAPPGPVPREDSLPGFSVATR